MNGSSTNVKWRLAYAAASVFAAVLCFSAPATAEWWCAPGAWGCSLTKEACEHGSKKKQCSEYPDVFMLDAKIRLSSFYPPYERQAASGSKFPLLVQCEAAHKQMARNSMYASVGTCRSQRAIVTEKVARIAKYAKSVAACQCITAERIREMFDAFLANAAQAELISDRQEKFDDVSKKEWFRQLDENSEALWRALDEAGSWDVMLAMGLSDPFEPPKPGTMQPEKDSKKEFDESRELFAKDYIISSSVSDRDIQDLRWATRNGEDPKASAIISVVAKNMEAVETTVKRKGFARAIVWAEEHLTDPRARCIVELTDKWRKRSKADLAKMDALARRKH